MSPYMPLYASADHRDMKPNMVKAYDTVTDVTTSAGMKYIASNGIKLKKNFIALVLIIVKFQL